MLLEMMMTNRPKSLRDAPDKPAAIKGVSNDKIIVTCGMCALFASSFSVFLLVKK